MIKNYTELIQISSYEDRLRYLKLRGDVAHETFGIERYINQKFYKSKEWKRIRDLVILRDEGCDLACPGMEIHGKIIIHHMNPITLDDLENDIDKVMDPEYLICVSLNTHNLIHYGSDLSVLDKVSGDRSPNDTIPWKKT